MSNDFGKAQEMVVASMEYVKVLGFRLRRTEAQRDDWKQVAQSHADEMIKLRQCVDALKAERDAERMVHDEYKERNRELFNRNQRLTAELAVIKDERDALRSTTIDTAAGRLLDAFGSLANEPRNGATDDEYRDRIVRKIHSIKMERDALRAEIDNLTTPCDPPEASHITPEGLKTAAGAVEPKPGDTVRLVRVPTPEDCPEYDSSDVAQMQAVRARIHTTGVVIGVAACGRCVRIALSSDNEIIKAWPISCIAIVEDAK